MNGQRAATGPKPVKSLVALLVLALAATACSTRRAGVDQTAAASRDATFAGTVVDPPLSLPDVVLRDTQGKPYRLSDQRPGEITVLFLGFTHCADICPTTMADLAAARRVLPTAEQELVNVLFVTVDPRRDTASVLRGWLDRYDSDLVGLIGVQAQIQRVERSLYAPVSGVGPHSKHGDSYQVEHSATVYAFAPDGRSLIYTSSAKPHQYASDFAALLGDT